MTDDEEHAPMSRKEKNKAVMMISHTPGPWSLEDWHEDDGPNRTTLTGYVPCKDDRERKVWGGDTRPLRVADLSEAENAEGNGPLLRAAPNMLEALLHARIALSTPGSRGPMALRMVEAAIAEATGETIPPDAQ